MTRSPRADEAERRPLTPEEARDLYLEAARHWAGVAARQARFQLAQERRFLPQFLEPRTTDGGRDGDG